MAVASLNPLEAPPPSPSASCLSLSPPPLAWLALASLARWLPPKFLAYIACACIYTRRRGARISTHRRRGGQLTAHGDHAEQSKKTPGPQVSQTRKRGTLGDRWDPAGALFFSSLAPLGGRQPTARTGSLARGTLRLPLVEGVYTRGNRGRGSFLGGGKGFKFSKNVMQMKPCR